MAEPTIDDLVDAFVDWALGREDADPDMAEIVHTALRSKVDDLGGRPEAWRRGDLEVLLLRVFPRKLRVGTDWVAATVPALRAFFRFLDESGRLALDSLPTAQLIWELDDLRSRYFVQMTVTDLDRRLGRDPTDLPDVDRPDLSHVRPPIVLVPSQPDLAGQVRKLPLVAKLTAFTTWIEERGGQELTEHGTLYWDHASTAATLLELPREAGEQSGLALGDVWSFGWTAGFLESHREDEYDDCGDEIGEVEYAVTTDLADGWPELADDAVLAAWQRMFEATLRPLKLPEPFDTERAAANADVLTRLAAMSAFTLLLELYGGGTVDLRRYADALGDRAHRELGVEGERQDFRVLARILLDATFRLQSLTGAVIPTADTLTLTPLGRWGVAQRLRGSGCPARTVASVPEASAVELLELWTDAGPEQANGWLTEWLEARSQDQAGSELVQAARSGNRRIRRSAFEALSTVGEAAAPAVRELLDEPAVRPYAIGWLQRLGAEPDQRLVMTADDERWRFVDETGAALQAGSTVDLGAVDVAFVEQLWRCGHSDTHDVLEFLGAAHPVKQVAKAARRAAFKLRSRPAA